ncbi:MAG: glucosidase, partial [Bacteroidota bacterium]
MNPEKQRLIENKEKGVAWKKWGPYLSERQWGTVREDYSPDGAAWSYLSHSMAMSCTYRWGEDGIGGISDEEQLLCMSVALWNGRDPILKERLFGLTGYEGNHGEDVKECYYYLDSTPTHSYMKMLYKYPQKEFPYRLLVDENRRRGRGEPEFELIDTGIFANDAYFDVFIEYAKEGFEDILMRITVHNRGAETAVINLVPQVWFRNTWSWGLDPHKPAMHAIKDHVVQIEHHGLGRRRWLYVDGDAELLFCENETNVQRLYAANRASGYFKDGINDYVVHGVKHAVNPEKAGTKLGANYKLSVPAGGSA